MTTTPSATRSQASRHLGMTWSTGLLLAALLGLGTAYARGEQFWLVLGASPPASSGPARAWPG